MGAYLICLGTPSDIVKMAPLCQALTARGQQLVMALSGPQVHALGGLCDFFELGDHLRVVLEDPQGLPAPLEPDLAIPQLSHRRPDAVLVQGSGPLARAYALAACRQGVPVAQLEAGESASRSLARDPVADRARWLFPFSAQASDRLRAQGVHSRRMHAVGSTAVDAALWTSDRIHRAGMATVLPPALRHFLQSHTQQHLLLVTAQQVEHEGPTMQRMAAAIGGLLQLHPELGVVWTLPTHPRSRSHVHMGLASQPPEILSRLLLTEDLTYPARIALLENSHFILTDCGELQQAASALHKPVLVLGRSAGPHPLVQAGAARQVNVTAQQIIEQACEWLTDPLLVVSMQLTASPWGDGQAAQRIAEVLCREAQPAVQTSRSHT